MEAVDSQLRRGSSAARCQPSEVWRVAMRCCGVLTLPEPAGNTGMVSLIFFFRLSYTSNIHSASPDFTSTSIPPTPFVNTNLASLSNHCSTATFVYMISKNCAHVPLFALLIFSYSWPSLDATILGLRNSHLSVCS